MPKQELPNWAYSPAASRSEPEPLSLEGADEEKAVEIEIQTETQLSRTGEETMPLKRVSMERIEAQRRHIAQLRKLTHFEEE